MSPDTSKNPSRPGRIIVPGEPDPPEAAEPLSGAEISDAPAGGSRIILPPGVARPEVEELPEFPRLRPLEIVPIREGGREMLLVTDPLGVMPAPVALRMDALELLSVLDGRLSLNDLKAEVVRASQDLRAAGHVDEFVAQLDRMLMLDSPRFAKAYDELRDSYHQLEIRQAVHASFSYPADRDELTRFLDGHFAEAERMRADAGQPVAPDEARPRALFAPHLDPRRAGGVIARAHLELGRKQPGPLRVVVFGTGHSLLGDTVALTSKHFETPFGLLRCDTAFVDAVAGRMGEAAYVSELAHRIEHSIEFQAVYLKHRFGDAPVTLVPILCGGFHALLDEGKTARDDSIFESMIAAVRETEKSLGGATVYLASVDLSHVGARFGDAPMDERATQEVEAKDRAALDAARRGDAEGWFDAIASHEDSTRICGWGATYAMLRCADPGEGRLLEYRPSAEPNGSIVTIAAMAWP